MSIVLINLYASIINNIIKTTRSIYITIHSYNPQQISIPDLVDYSSRQALSLLNSIGFTDVRIVEMPAQYSGLVLSLEYKGRKLLADEGVPLGHPLTLVVGKSIDQDSLDFNQENLILPSDINRGNDNLEGSRSSNSSMDDSFF